MLQYSWWSLTYSCLCT